MICENCGKEFNEDWRKNKKGDCRFCTKNCANTRKHCETTKQQISKSLTKHPINYCFCGKIIKHNAKQCKQCYIKRKRVCVICKTELTKENTYKKKGTNPSYCKECLNAYSINRWIQKKIEAINYKGGKCVKCGYN